MDPSSGKKNQDFFFYVDMEEEFLFLLYKDLGCRFDNFLLFSTSNMCPVGFIPWCPLTLFVYLYFLSGTPKDRWKIVEG
jgi:hypothetical protein